MEYIYLNKIPLNSNFCKGLEKGICNMYMLHYCSLRFKMKVSLRLLWTNAFTFFSIHHMGILYRKTLKIFSQTPNESISPSERIKNCTYSLVFGKNCFCSSDYIKGSTFLLKIFNNHKIFIV